MARQFILHVLTKSPDKPWIVHYEGHDYEADTVSVNVPSHTRRDGHIPCANWYITGSARNCRWVGERTLVLE